HAQVLIIAVLDAGLGLILPAAALFGMSRDANAELVGDDGRVQHAADHFTRIAAADERFLRFDRTAEASEVRRLADVANGAGHRALAVQRALRALLHFDALQVEGARV